MKTTYITPTDVAKTPLDKLKKSSKDFEAIIVGELFKAFRKSIPKNSLTSGGFGEEIFSSMLDQSFAQEISKRGTLGVSNMVEKQLSKFLPTDTPFKLSELLKYRGKFSSPTNSKINSKFGPRIHPIYNKMMMHEGVDFEGKIGDKILSSSDGKVIFSGEKKGYGKTVIVEEGDFKFYYAHCDQIDLKEGDEIKKGDEIGTIGDTGITTGPHLHFEIRYKDTPIDPLLLIKMDNGKNLKYK